MFLRIRCLHPLWFKRLGFPFLSWIYAPILLLSLNLISLAAPSDNRRVVLEFPNGAKVTFVMDQGIRFRPKGGEEKVVATGVLSASLSPVVQKALDQGLVISKVNAEDRILVVQVDNRPFVITQTGEAGFPADLDQECNYVSFEIHKRIIAGSPVDFMFLSLRYSEKGRAKPKETDKSNHPPHGETFLIRDDGQRFRIASRFYPLNEVNYRDGVYSFEGSGLQRAIDLDHFEREAAFEVSPRAFVDDADGKSVDPLEYVSSFATDVSRELALERLDYEPLNEETKAAFSRAFIKREMGSTVVLGPAGSGKTETVMRFVSDVLAGRVPHIPRSTKFLSLNASTLAAGTRYLGSIEAKINAMFEASRALPIIWIVDEIHSLVGQGTHSSNRNDVLQSLKPFLSSGTMKFIGMTTRDEFYRAFSADRALVERFQVIEQKVPSISEAVLKYGAWARKYGRPVPSEGVLQRIYQLSNEFNAIGAQPRKGVVLLNEAYADLDLRGAGGRAPEVSEVEAAARRVYHLHPDHFSLGSIAEKIRQLPGKLDAKIVGQKAAKAALIRQATVGLMGTHDPERPRMSLFLSGPKGVGKTELAYAYADAMELPVERILMSRFSYDSSPVDLLRVLKRALERNAFTVFLLDEVDKTPVHMMDALLSVFDKGQFVLPEHTHVGEYVGTAEVSARNASFILAANAAANFSKQKARVGFAGANTFARRTSSAEEFRSALVQDGISEFLLDRIQECVFMDYLTKEEFRDVLGLHFNRILSEQSERHSVSLTAPLQEAFLGRIVERLYEPRMSNRVAVRVLQNELRYALAQGMMAAGGALGGGLVVNHDDATHEFSVVSCEAALAPELVWGEPEEVVLPRH